MISREEEIPLFFICARTKFLDFPCMFATLQKNSEGNSLSDNKEKRKIIKKENKADRRKQNNAVLVSGASGWPEQSERQAHVGANGASVSEQSRKNRQRKKKEKK